MSSVGAKVEGYRVMIVSPSKVWISKDAYCSTLGDLQRNGHLTKPAGKWTVGRDTINKIESWAKANGYSGKERRSAK